MLKVGLLGAGRIGKVHAAAITSHDDSRLVAVSDVVSEAAEALGQSYGAEARTSDEIINDPNIDAVLVATSTDTHSDLVEAATAAGKAVLCEKPLDLDLKRAKTCRDNANATGQPVMLGFNRRFDPGFAEIRASLAAGEIGKPELLIITSFDPAPPPLDYIEVTGGIFRDMTIHDFDMANFILGDLPETISATGSTLVAPEIKAAGDFDTAVVTMRYGDGRIATIHNSRRAAYGYDQRLEILGEKGLLQASNKLESNVTRMGADGIVSAKPVYFFLERYMSAYRAEWAAFVDAVTNGSPMPVGIDDGVAALAMAEAATLSVHSEAPVALAALLD